MSLAQLAFCTFAFGAPAIGASGPPDDQGEPRHRDLRTSRWHLSLSGESTSYDFAPRAFGPGLSLVAAADLATRRSFSLRLGPKLGYALVPDFLHSLSAGGRASASWSLPGGFAADVNLGLGYRHHWLAQPVYVVRDGVLASSSGAAKGSPAAEFALGSALGYDFRARTGRPLSLLLGYEVKVITPFWPRVGVPVMVATTLGVQLRVHLPQWRRE